MTPRRLGLIIPLALFGVFFALYTALWLRTADVMKQEIEAFARAEEAAGRSFSHQDVQVAGYPMTLRGTIKDAQWSDGNGYGFSAETLKVVTLPYDASRILFAPRDAMTVTLRGEIFDVSAGGLVFSLERAFAAAEGSGLTLKNSVRTVMIGNLIVNRRDLGQGTALAADLRDIDLGGKLAIQLPYLQLSGGLADDVLTIGSLALSVGRARDPAPTSFEADGRVYTDATGTLSGNLDVTVSNERAAIMLLADTGIVNSTQRDLMIGGFGLLTEQGTKQITLPLVLEQGAASLGGLPFGRIPLGTIPPLAD